MLMSEHGCWQEVTHPLLQGEENKNGRDES